MRNLFFIAVFIIFSGCSEPLVVPEKAADTIMPEKTVEKEIQPVEKTVEVREETPDISEDLKKLRKIPGENNEEGNGDCTGYLDRDGDGFGIAENTVKFNCAGSSPVGYAGESGDCNDSNRYINPKVEETCNGFDDNCDGLIDPENSKDCNRYYKDSDEDGYGTGDPKCLCVSEKEYSALESGDCDDNNRKVYPSAKEICNDLDDNCNGEIDEGENDKDCRPFYIDNDGDGFGYDKDGKCLCKATGMYRAEKIGDCNDNNPVIYPGAPELFDRLDNDCNGVVDDNTGIPRHPQHHNKEHDKRHDND
ncbi:MAG TPA: putative metal-binding motif-containing protein [bacterium]|nr:putative metal-binding motif-containing protein [bacterium]HPS30848.1 putative metal-binding motif-containing protein [bacterium]